MSWYGIITPESTNDGMMKKTVRKTACAEVRASAETKTPIASEASTKGSVTTKSVTQLPRGQKPKSEPGRHERDQHLRRSRAPT